MTKRTVLRYLWDGGRNEESTQVEEVHGTACVEGSSEGGNSQERPASIDNIRSKEEEKLSESARLLKSMDSLGISMIHSALGGESLGDSVSLSEKSYRELRRLSFDVNYGNRKKRGLGHSYNL